MLGSKESKSPEKSNHMLAHLMMKCMPVTDQTTSQVLYLLVSHPQMGSMVVRYTAIGSFLYFFAKVQWETPAVLEY